MGDTVATATPLPNGKLQEWKVVIYREVMGDNGEKVMKPFPKTVKAMHKERAVQLLKENIALLEECAGKDYDTVMRELNDCKYRIKSISSGSNEELV